ncbi:hypothetical protein [Maritimibacter sp. 55A14]|uniref:hypothetical protein n=1 Tax=Maritimibacter sp. 55A14 TaxID=2174844 RepID=UPI0018EE49BF|nr:hypothetical protein [Maritimibacter sp. 55A14]
MLVIIGFVVGALWGARVAMVRKGNRADIAQYAAGYGIAFGILGLFATMVIGWTGLG